MRSFLLGIFLICSSLAIAQNQQLLDSLRRSLQTDLPDTVRLSTYSSLVQNWIDYNADSSLYYAKASEEVARRISKEKHAVALGNISLAHRFKGNFDEGIKAAEEGWKIAQSIGNEKVTADLNKSLGSLYQNKGDLAKAAQYFYDALKTYEKVEDHTKVCNVLSTLGSIHSDMMMMDKAIEYQTRAVEVAKKHADPNELAGCYNNLAATYQSLKEYDRALNYYRECLTIVEETGMTFGIAVTSVNIGAIHAFKGDWDAAIDYYKKGLALQEQMGYSPGIAQTNMSLGFAYAQVGQNANALKHLELSYNMAKELKSDELLQATGLRLAQTYEKLGRHSEAYQKLFEFHFLADSLRGKKLQEQIAELTLRYGLERKEDSLELAKKELVVERLEKDKAEKESAKKDILLVAAGIGVILLLGFGAFILKASRDRKKANVVLEEKNAEISNQKLIVEEKNKEILDSITYAKRIQEAILPPTRIVKEWLPNSFILYKPKDIVAGDFYWMEHVGSKIYFSAADCTGHGVPGAMVSVVCHNAMNRAVREFGLTKPGEILDRTTKLVVEQFEKSEEDVKDGMDLALCVLDTETRMLSYAGANNPLWIIRKEGHELEEVKATKQPVGKSDKPMAFVTHDIQLSEGDTIYVFSDGYADQFGGARGKKYKYKTFKEKLLSIQHESMDKQRALLNEEFEAWRGELEQLDDVCVIGVRV